MSKSFQTWLRFAAVASIVFASSILAASSAPVNWADAKGRGDARLKMEPGSSTFGKTGRILTTSDGGQIFGFGIDQNGTDGLLASAVLLGAENRVSVQTFDTTDGTITKTFAAATTKDDYVVDGIFAGDVGLVTHEVVPAHSPYAIRRYELLNPVNGGAFTGRWTPPVADVEVLQNAENQSTTSSVVYAIELKQNDDPVLVASDVGANTFGKVIPLDRSLYGLCNGPQLAQDTLNDRAVLATSSDCGAVGGPPPTIATVNLRSGKIQSFPGVNCPPPYGCGDANGIAFDSNSQIAVTTTEVDAGVEFYNFARHTAMREGLPNNPSQQYAGTYVASDSLHKLFLVAQPYSSTSPQGSSIQVYDEKGTLVESIDGLNFQFANSVVIPIKVAIDPNRRFGWVNGPTVQQLQQFRY